MILDGTNQGAERVGVTKYSVLDHFKDLCETWIKFMSAVGMCVTKFVHILSQVTKEEDVVLSNLTSDFNLRWLASLFYGVLERRK